MFSWAGHVLQMRESVPSVRGLPTVAPPSMSWFARTEAGPEVVVGKEGLEVAWRLYLLHVG